MTQYGPEFFRKFADIIIEAEQPVDEGVMDTVKGVAQKVGSVAKDAYKTVTDPEYAYHKNWDANKQRGAEWEQDISHTVANNPGMSRDDAMDQIDRKNTPADSSLNIERTFGVDHNSDIGKWLYHNDDIRKALVKNGIEKLNPQQKQQFIQQAIQKYGR